MTWALVVPVKRLATAKTRLEGLTAEQRADLALAFALDTVVAARAGASVVDVLVVTDDLRATAAMRDLGVAVEPDRPDAGLNPALEHGARVLAARHPGVGVGALSSDLPALRTAELDLALEAAADVPAALVSDHGGLGTTLLVARDADAFVPRFGTRSRAAHRAAGVAEPELGARVPSLRGDVDTEVDLREAERLGVGRHTAAVLDAQRRAGR